MLKIKKKAKCKLVVFLSPHSGPDRNDQVCKGAVVGWEGGWWGWGESAVSQSLVTVGSARVFGAKLQEKISQLASFLTRRRDSF